MVCFGSRFVRVHLCCRHLCRGHIVRSGRLWTAVPQQQHRRVVSHPVVPCASILLRFRKQRRHCMLSKQTVLPASLSLTPFSSRRVYLLSPQRCQCNLLANNSTQSLSIDPMISSMPQNCHKLLNAESLSSLQYSATTLRGDSFPYCTNRARAGCSCSVPVAKKEWARTSRAALGRWCLFACIRPASLRRGGQAPQLPLEGVTAAR